MGGWLASIFAGGTEGVLKGAGSFAKDIREAITGKTITDPAVMAEIALKAEQLALAAEQAQLTFEAEMSKGQTAINAIEAQNTNMFVSGWRPAVGWVCVSGLFYTFLMRPLLPWCIAVGGIVVGKTPVIPALPGIDIGELIVLLAGMLGLTVARSIDKYNKVTGPPNNQG